MKKTILSSTPGVQSDMIRPFQLIYQPPKKDP